MKLFGSAVVLAGGRSTRMGFDKAFIKIGGKTIIEGILGKLCQVFEDLIIVTDSPEKYSRLNARVVQDIVSNAGPLGGIHAGLMASKSRYAFITACDMPFVSLEYIRYMNQIADRYQPDAIVSRKGKWVEPLHALYSTELVFDIEQKLAQGLYKVTHSLENKRVITVEEDKVREFSPGLEIFFNLNTGSDLEQIQSLLGGKEVQDGILQDS